LRLLSASSSLTCCSPAWEWPRGTHEKESSYLLVVHPGDHGHVRSDLSARHYLVLTTVVSQQGQRTTARKRRQAGWIPNYRASVHRPRLLPLTPVGCGNGEQKLHAENPGSPVPADLVTTSASGLDPDISPAAAEFQISRVARERHLRESELRALVTKHTLGRQLAVLGEPRVNVLELNLDLDAQHPLSK
jgi:hypothetical protein